MAVFRTVVQPANADEIRKVLQKRYGNAATIRLEECTDFMGQSWTEAVIKV